MPAPEQGLWADACPGAGTLGISLRVDSRSWPQSTLGFGKPPVILAILASAFGIQNTTIFKYPIEHVHIFFLSHCLSNTTSPKKIKESHHFHSLNQLFSLLTPPSSLKRLFQLWPMHFSFVSTFRLLRLWHLTDFPRLLCQGCCFPSCFTLGRRSWGHRRAFYPPESILYLAVRLPLRSCHTLDKRAPWLSIAFKAKESIQTVLKALKWNPNHADLQGHRSRIVLLNMTGFSTLSL